MENRVHEFSSFFEGWRIFFNYVSNWMVCAVKRNKEKSSGEARLYPRKQKTQGAGRWDFIFTKYPLNQREHDLVKVVNWPDNGSPEKRLSTRGGQRKREDKT